MQVGKRKIIAGAAAAAGMLAVAATATWGSTAATMVVACALLLVAALGLGKLLAGLDRQLRLVARRDPTRELAALSHRIEALEGAVAQAAQDPSQSQALSHRIEALEAAVAQAAPDPSEKQAEDANLPQAHFQQLLRTVEANRIRLELAIDQLADRQDAATASTSDLSNGTNHMNGTNGTSAGKGRPLGHPAAVDR